MNRQAFCQKDNLEHGVTSRNPMKVSPGKPLLFVDKGVTALERPFARISHGKLTLAQFFIYSIESKQLGNSGIRLIEPQNSRPCLTKRASEHAYPQSDSLDACCRRLGHFGFTCTANPLNSGGGLGFIGCRSDVDHLASVSVRHILFSDPICREPSL